MVLIGMNIGAHFVVFPFASLIKNAFSSVQVVIINVILTVIVALSAAYLTTGGSLDNAGISLGTGKYVEARHLPRSL